MRFANTFAPLGGPGVAVDIYDDLYVAPSATAVPIVAGLAYATVSDYVIPRFTTTSSHEVALTALPAGNLPTDTADATLVGSWDADGYMIEQETILLSSDTGFSTADGGTVPPILPRGYLEKSVSGGQTVGPSESSPATGDGAFLADDCAIQNSLGLLPSTGFFFLVDGACAVPDINTRALSPNLRGCEADLATMTPVQFSTPAGVHQISVGWTDTTASTCTPPASQSAAQSVTLGEGQEIWAWVYGQSGSNPQLLLAPIAL